LVTTERLFSRVNVHVRHEHRVLGELLATLIASEAHHVNALLVLVPNTVGGELEVAVTAREVLLVLVRVFLEPVFLESVLNTRFF
jgi:hypothetical protein